jgi:HK97 family phage major capsid protein
MTGTKYDARRQAELTEQRRTIIKTCESIVGAAKAAGRELTGSEQDAVNAGMAKIDNTIDPELKTLGKAMVDAVLKSGGTPDWTDPEGSGGSFFTPEAKNGIIAAIKTRTAYRAELPAKAALTVGNLLPPTGSMGFEGLHPNAQFPLSELFVQVPAEAPVVRYYRIGAGAAAVVAEGAPKPDAGITIEGVDLALTKLACLASYTDEMAEDAPFLVSRLSTELAAAVLAAENAAILGTFNTTSGVLTDSGAAADVVDLVADAIASSEAISGNTPSAVIANPTVVAAIRRAKASTAGTYVLDPLTAGPTTIHGVRLISTPATAAGTAWVVDAAGVVIYRRGPLTVEVGTNADDWAHNTRTARAEERMATAVVRPTALTKLTLT